MKIRSHDVAQVAYQCVAARKTFAEKKQYGALAHQLPILILQNGLAQATGFLLAKGTDSKPDKDTHKSKNQDQPTESAHCALLNDLANVLGYEKGVPHGKTLHATVIAADALTTMQLTRRALEATGWIKRYVQGVLKVDATGSSVEGSAT